jgi:hypothetical protein
MSNELVIGGPDALLCGIQKNLIYAGKKQVDYKDGTKVIKKTNKLHCLILVDS